MMGAPAILVVVWLGLGTGATYQVAFSTVELCETAQKVVLDDAARVRTNLGSNSSVMTSAVCLKQNGILAR
jgi:hypothetical protein